MLRVADLHETEVDAKVTAERASLNFKLLYFKHG